MPGGCHLTWPIRMRQMYLAAFLVFFNPAFLFEHLQQIGEIHYNEGSYFATYTQELPKKVNFYKHLRSVRQQKTSSQLL